MVCAARHLGFDSPTGREAGHKSLPERKRETMSSIYRKSALALEPGDVFEFPAESHAAHLQGRVHEVVMMTSETGMPVVRVIGEFLSSDPARLVDEGDDFCWFALIDWHVAVS